MIAERVAAIAVIAAACGGNTSKADDELFGHAVVPPAPLAAIRPGMSLAELRALVPELSSAEPERGWRVPYDRGGAKLFAIVVDEHVVDTYVALDGDTGAITERLTAAWGPRDAEPDRLEVGEPAWRSTVTGWRARLTCRNGGCLITYHPHRALDTLFAAVAPPGAFARLHIGMTTAQVKAITGLPLDDNPLWQQASDYDGAIAHVDAVEDRLYRIDFHLPAMARALIEHAWGPPRATTKDGMFWTDPVTGWRAHLAPDDRPSLGAPGWDLDFIDVRSIDQLVGTLESLAGKPSAAIRKAHPELLPWASDDMLYLPMVDLVTSTISVNTPVALVDEGGSVRATMVVDADDMLPGARDTMLAALAAKYGDPEPVVADRLTTRRYSDHVRVQQLSDQPNKLIVEVK